jgi:hypothetical protein
MAEIGQKRLYDQIAGSGRSAALFAMRSTYGERHAL